ncbi:hypothetical protein H2199_002822 [Coniosporium tulheliwenetii]|uniref:Uncharacterized protein n=1 Tax=Coniosporium tulheliwenetii TaxID=3383036 RepID=A0ACC2ZDI0_9PEZI|nr:hypothetical protein H2199_002822 [Cladosporium sp. JES 115]
MSYNGDWAANMNANLSGRPGTTSLPNPNHWSCHACGFGPMSFALYVQCIKCGHKPQNCSYCTSEYLSVGPASPHTASGSSRGLSSQGGPSGYMAPAEAPPPV